MIEVRSRLPNNLQSDNNTLNNRIHILTYNRSPPELYPPCILTSTPKTTSVRLREMNMLLPNRDKFSILTIFPHTRLRRNHDSSG